jgi:uncharacterized protein (DUF2342 family)
LHHVFSAPEALPTLPELQDPSAWLARIAVDGAAPQRSSA